MVTHEQIFAALQAAGIIKDASAVNRVVIDARRGCFVIIHVEQIGDDKVLDVARTLHGPLISEPEPDGVDGLYVRGAEPQLASVTQLNPDGASDDPVALADIEADRCRINSCATEIFFATTERGKHMPVDYASAGDGNSTGTLAVRRDDGRLRCRVVKLDEELQPGEVRATSHYVTCTRPDSFRRSR